MYWYRSHATQKWGNNTLNMPLKGYLLQRGGQEMDKHRFEALREDAKDKCHQYLAGLPDLPSQYKYKTFEYFHHRYRDVWDRLATDFSKDWVELTYYTTNWKSVAPTQGTPALPPNRSDPSSSTSTSTSASTVNRSDPSSPAPTPSLSTSGPPSSSISTTNPDPSSSRLRDDWAQSSLSNLLRSRNGARTPGNVASPHSQQTEQGPGASDLDASSSRHDHQAGQEESGVTPARPDPTVTSTAVESDTAALNTTSTIPTATSSTEPTTAPQVISSDGNTEGTDANPIGGTSTATPTPTADITTTEGTVTPEALSKLTREAIIVLLQKREPVNLRPGHPRTTAEQSADGSGTRS
ncbi:unnamed protein product [Tilletia caries]|nr:unnamed protein product [Tilletia caries]